MLLLLLLFLLRLQLMLTGEKALFEHLKSLLARLCLVIGKYGGGLLRSLIHALIKNLLALLFEHHLVLPPILRQRLVELLNRHVFYVLLLNLLSRTHLLNRAVMSGGQQRPEV